MEGGKTPKSTDKCKHKSHRYVSSSSEESDLPLCTKKPSPGEEPGREEEQSREPRSSIVYRDLKHKEKADMKRQFRPDPVVSREVDISDFETFKQALNIPESREYACLLNLTDGP